MRGDDLINGLKDYWWVITTFVIPIATFFIGRYKKKNEDQDNKIKELIKDDELTKEALKILLQSNLTNQYFVYEQTGEIKDYQLKSWLNQLKAYEGLDGNDYIHELDRRIKKMKIIKTDILK